MSRRASSFAGALLLALVVPLGCANRDRAVPTDRGAQPLEAIDAPLLAYLSAARALHHEADLAEDGNDPSGALAALERLIALRPPRAAPEIDEVLADTRSRLADLRSGLGDFDGAEREIDAGLVVAPRRTYFRGHLFEVRGLIEERRAKALTASGDRAGGSRAKEEAMRAYEQAIEVQGAVIRQGARDGGAADGR